MTLCPEGPWVVTAPHSAWMKAAPESWGIPWGALSLLPSGDACLVWGVKGCLVWVSPLRPPRVCRSEGGAYRP